MSDLAQKSVKTELRCKALLGRQIVGEPETHPEMKRMAREGSRFHAALPQDDGTPTTGTPEGEPLS